MTDSYSTLRTSRQRAPVEPAQPACQRTDEWLAARDFHDPVEEVGLDDAVDATLVELAAAQQGRRRDDFESKPTRHGR